MRTHPSSRPLRAVVAGVTAVGFILGAAACAPAPAESGHRSLSIGLSAPLDVNWNPFAYADAYWPSVQAVYDRLFVTDPSTGQYIPWLAKEFELSDDGMTLSLTLRDDVDFVDGVHMDAAGVADYLNALLSSGGYAYGYEVDRYELVFTATGEYTLEMVSELPIRDDAHHVLWGDLSRIPIVSPEAVKDPSVLDEKPVGSGPYIVKTQGADSVTFERNPDYWNPEAFDFDEVKVTAFEDRIAALNALKSGQIDVTQLDLSLAGEAKSSGFELATARQGFTAIYIADRDGSVVPALGDVRVRQAMSMALDREAINEAIHHGFGTVGTEPFTEDQILYVAEAEGRDAYDLEHARELMAEAGYADGFDLLIPQNSAFMVDDYLPVIKQSFSEIGIRVTYEAVDDLVGAVADGTYAVAVWTPGYTWGWSALPTILGGFNHPRVDELVKLIDSAPTNEEYKDALNELGEIYVDELWFVVVGQPYEIYATNDQVDVAVFDVNTNAVPSIRDYTAED